MFNCVEPLKCQSCQHETWNLERGTWNTSLNLEHVPDLKSWLSGSVEPELFSVLPGYNPHMRLTSPAFADGDMLPVKHTTDGLNISPPLRWDEVPERAKSFALTLTDPDAPGGWIHWLVCNIRADSRYVPDGGPVPRGAREVRNDFGKQSYEGPCPPTGEHRYVFTLYALDTEHLPTRIRKGNFIEICRRHMIEKSVLTGRYRAGGPVVGI